MDLPLGQFDVGDLKNATFEIQIPTVLTAFVVLKIHIAPSWRVAASGRMSLAVCLRQPAPPGPCSAIQGQCDVREFESGTNRPTFKSRWQLN